MSVHQRPTEFNSEYQSSEFSFLHKENEGVEDSLNAWEILSDPFEVSWSSSNIFLLDSPYSPKNLFQKGLVKVLFCTSHCFRFLGLRKVAKCLSCYRLHIINKLVFLNTEFIQNKLRGLFEKAISDLKAADADSSKTQFERALISQEILNNYSIDFMNIYLRCWYHFDLKRSVE